MKSKGHHAWVKIKGRKKIFMRSRWEANYARYLEWKKNLGLIVEWKYEAETFWFDKIKRGVRSYLPDFKVFTIDNGIEFHEVKGWMDPASRTKLKRMKKYHPTVKIILIDAVAFRALSKKMSLIVPEWETTK